MRFGKELKFCVPQFPISDDETNASKFVERTKNNIHIGFVKWYDNASYIIIKQYS